MTTAGKRSVFPHRAPSAAEWMARSAVSAEMLEMRQ
jgi:hypothetical protein